MLRSIPVNKYTGSGFPPPQLFSKLGATILLNKRGARWLIGRVSDSSVRGGGFETYLRLSRVLSLSKTLYSTKVLVIPRKWWDTCYPHEGRADNAAYRHYLSIYLSLLSQSFSDHHLRCGVWLNLEFSKREKHSGWGIKTIYKK